MRALTFRSRTDRRTSPGAPASGPMPDLDAETLAAFRRGDGAAVSAVYRRFSGSVMAVASSIVADRDTAADVVQQTFVKAWRRADTFDASRSMGPWLRTIARNTALDTVRAAQRRRSVSIDLVAEPAATSTPIDAAWVAGQVRSALDQLPEDERAVVQLAHLEGLTHPEIAERLGVPVGTVKSRSHRAHRRLASHLNHLRDESGPGQEMGIGHDA